MTKFTSTLLVVVIMIGIWYLAAFVGPLTRHLPTPHEVFRASFTPMVLPQIVSALMQTAKSVGEALLLGTVLGYFFGLWLGLSDRFGRLVCTTIDAFRSIPVTVLIPLFMALFGIRRFFIPIVAFPIILHTAVNVYYACRQANDQRRALLVSYGVTLPSYICHVLWHQSLEAVFATIRIMVAFALALEVALDFFLNTDQGLGAFISLRYSQPHLVAEAYGAVVLVALMGVVFVSGVDLIASRRLKWIRSI